MYTRTRLQGPTCQMCCIFLKERRYSAPCARSHTRHLFKNVFVDDDQREHDRKGDNLQAYIHLGGSYQYSNTRINEQMHRSHENMPHIKDTLRMLHSLVGVKCRKLSNEPAIMKGRGSRKSQGLLGVHSHKAVNCSGPPSLVDGETSSDLCRLLAELLYFITLSAFTTNNRIQAPSRCH